MSWQIVPRQLGRLLSNPDRTKSKRVMEALMPMKKIKLAELERAAER
ncbi:MAG: hypothetical protein ACOH1P_06005 [Lysobacter sp.]